MNEIIIDTDATFDIEIDCLNNEEIYHLKGECDIIGNKAYDFKIDARTSRFCGFGSGEQHRLPKLAIPQLELFYSVQILDAINKNIKDGL